MIGHSSEVTGNLNKYYCSGFEVGLLNREGKPWPNVDFTLVNLAQYSKEGYEDRLAITTEFPKASALVSECAMDIVTQRNQLHVYKPFIYSGNHGRDSPFDRKKDK